MNPIDPFVITVSANDNMEFTNIDQVAVELDEESAGLPTGLIVPTRSEPLAGDILITVSGNYPAQGGIYNIPINIQATAPLDAANAALAAAEAYASTAFSTTTSYTYTGVPSGNPFPNAYDGSVIYTDAGGIELIQYAGLATGSIHICAQDIAGVSPRLAPIPGNPNGVGTIVAAPENQDLCDGGIFGRRGVPYAGDAARVNGFEIVEGTTAPTSASPTTITLVPASTS